MPSIRPGDHPHHSTVSGGPWNAKYVAEAISEMCSMQGIEWSIVPEEPGTTWDDYTFVTRATPANVPCIGYFYTYIPDPIWEPQTRFVDPPPMFEYGTTRANVTDYTFSVDRDASANQVFVPRMGYPEPGYLGAETTQNVIDNTAADAFGRLQAWVEPGEVYLSTARLALANTHLALRKGPRRRVRFSPAMNNQEEPFVSYGAGKWVRFRAFDGDTLRYDLDVRIWAMEVTIDDNGNERVTVETVENGG